jgi:hypothetical protein
MIRLVTITGAVVVAMVVATSADDTKRYDLHSFAVTGPAGQGWDVMSQSRETVWFSKALSVKEFSMIGIQAIRDIEAEQWGLSDENLAKSVIQEYRDSTVRSGHTVENEQFEEKQINHKTFYTSTAHLPVIHALRVDPQYDANELVYIYVAPRSPETQPIVYFFLFTDVRKREEPFESHLKEFLSVIVSFEPKEGEGLVSLETATA